MKDKLTVLTQKFKYLMLLRLLSMTMTLGNMNSLGSISQNNS